jgi:hypothetical protein
MSPDEGARAFRGCAVLIGVVTLAACLVGLFWFEPLKIAIAVVIAITLIWYGAK